MYIRTRKEQLIEFLKLNCHLDPTRGHLGEKKTIARITERYLCSGVAKDVKNMVNFYFTVICKIQVSLLFHISV